MKIINVDYYKYQNFNPETDFHRSNPEPISNAFHLVKSKSQLIRQPFIQLPQKIAPDEEFKFVNYIVLRNIVPNRYIVSNYGRIFDLKTGTTPILSAVSESNDGYQYCYLSYFDNFGRLLNSIKTLHRIVMLTFCYIYNCEYLTVNHLNGNHSDNRLCNLEWATNNENIEHAKKSGLIASGQFASNAVLDSDQVAEICKLILNGNTIKNIAEKFNISESTIIKIKNGTGYKNESKEFIEDIKRYEESKNSQLIYEINEICKYLEQGYGNLQISQLLNVSIDRVRTIKEKKAYTEISKNYKIPEISHPVRLTDEIIEKICQEYQSGKRIIDIANELGVNYESCKGICTGRYHKNISCKYSRIRKM